MRALAAILLVGCASGHSFEQPVDGDVTSRPHDADTSGVDAKQYLDAKPVPPPDAPPDAKPDAKPIDAPPALPPDAYVCTTKTRQLLINPVLDLNPSGMGWIQQNIDNAYPIVTGDDGVVEQSAPFKAWMGGFAGTDKGVSSVTDMLYQDIAIPAGTTQLVLTGYYEVRTAETTSSVYDSAQLALTHTDGTPIQTVLSVSNLTPTTAWTAINFSFANPASLSGQTLRLRATSTNDITDATSFYFDTFALTATYCE